MRNASCALCPDSLPGPAYLVDGARRYPGRRRWFRDWLLICPGCFEFGYDTETGRYRSAGAREFEGASWTKVLGRGELLPPTPCEACGRVVIRNDDPLLKRVTCSRACSTSLTTTRNGNQGSGQPCGTCGQTITTGRADARYCSPACRQRAYRERSKVQHAQP
jgi:hypothetical protein